MAPTVVVNVEPTPVTVDVRNDVQPAPVSVAAPEVRVEAPVVTVVVPEEKPSRTVTTFERDGNGLVKKSTAIETVL